MSNIASRKIIHIDMDCFYAAIEIRDNPVLADKPVAVGGSPEERGVLCTCNYIARKFGVKSAMATAYAKKLCPNLIVLPVNMQKYREAARVIHGIFREYTILVEPLSLDEAYLDVTNSPFCNGSATWIAKEIRQKIWDTLQLTASAGVAPNKMLAKIASGWNKPNGLFVIRPEHINTFIENLSVEELFGVGKVTAQRLHLLGIQTCKDLQSISLTELTNHFGKFGAQLYDQCRGIDQRTVEPHRVRKSLSVEQTFKQDIFLDDACFEIMEELYAQLINRIQKNAPDRAIKNQYIKVKFSDFKLTTIERSVQELNFDEYKNLLTHLIHKEEKKIRLLGMGVHFSNDKQTLFVQEKLFK